MNRKVVRINEEQYCHFFLSEERHYPSFLDGFKKDVSVLVYKRVVDKLGKGCTTFDFVLPYECEFVDNVRFNVEVVKNGDINNIKSYVCHYYNGKNHLKDGKVDEPTIFVNIPYVDKTVMFPMLYVALSRELTHLYDDWIALRNGHNGINFEPTNIDTTKFVNTSHGVVNDEPFKSLSILAYMSLQVEQKAFLSQTVQELELVGCTLENYRVKLRETSLYSNITKAYDNTVKQISNSGADPLRRTNDYIRYAFPNTNIPTMVSRTFDADEFRKKLLRWAENVRHNLLKRYGSVLSYYLDNLREERDKKYGASFYV